MTTLILRRQSYRPITLIAVAMISGCTVLPAGPGGENRPPVVDMAETAEGVAGEPLTLDASNSFDPDGEVASFVWELSDGTTLEGAVVDHAFDQPGQYEVTLTITDDVGGTSTATIDILITDPPSPNILTVTLDPPDAGQVLLDPPGGSYAAGEVVTVTVQPGAGFVFNAFEGDVTGGENPIEIVMDGDLAVTAVLSPIQVTLTVDVSPPGGGDVTLTPGGGVYDFDTVVEVSATASSGYEFRAFIDESGATLGRSNTIDLVLEGDLTITAVFRRIPTDTWTPAIGNPGNLLVTGFVGKNVTEFDRHNGASLGEVVAAGAGGLSVAGGIDIGPTGDIFVVNVGIVSDTSIIRYDGTDGSLVSEFVTGPGVLGYITAKFGGPNGNLFVANNVSDTVEEYDGSTGAFVRDFVTSGSGGLDNPVGMTFGPSGNLFVVSQASNTVLEYDGVTGAHERVVVGFDAYGFTVPVDLVFGPDDLLYVTTSGAERVARVDVSTGVATEFVSAGAGGLDSPGGLGFHPDTGNLLVVSQGTDSVLEYDGTDGAFVGVFASGAGGENLFMMTFREP